MARPRGTTKENIGTPEQRAVWTQKHNLAFEYYTDPKSETFDNALRSCLKAGLPEGTASKVTSTDWWKIRCQRFESMMPKIERNIGEILDLDTKVKGRINPQLLKIKGDMTIFVAETIGRKKFTKKIEIEDMTPPKIEHNPMLKKLFKM